VIAFLPQATTIAVGTLLAYPSLAANRGQGLYLNFANFGSSHDPQSQTNFYYYYPLANGLKLKASGQVTSSSTAYTYCQDSVGTVRWGDFTATSYIWPTGSSWTARFFLLDQYATSSSNISLQITGLVPPGT
jgi:spermidine/putrescine-binding protein